MKLPIEGRWLGLIAVIAAVFAGGLVLAVRFVRLPTPPAQKPPLTPNRGIGVTMVDGSMSNALLREQALLDPDPLFLPTEFNASQPQIPALVRREPGETFQPVSAKYAYTLAAAPVLFPEPIVVPAQAVDALTNGRTQNLYDVLGRFSRDEPALPERLAVIEVVQTRTGRVIFSTPLRVADVPLQVAGADWHPLELLAAIDATGLIGLPVLSRGSGVEAVDTFFRSYLAKEFHLGERLPPGFYTLRVGP